VTIISYAHAVRNSWRAQNVDQEAVIKQWRPRIFRFALAEGPPVAISLVAGAVVGLLFVSIWNLSEVAAAVKQLTNYSLYQHCIGALHQKLITWSLLCLSALVIWAFLSVAFVAGLARSWIFGLQRYSSVVAFACGWIAMYCQYADKHKSAFLCLLPIPILLAVEFGLLLSAELFRFRTRLNKDVPPSRAPIARERPFGWRSHDDPIDAWQDDVLNRGAIVDLLKKRIFMGRVPVLALCGKFGDGKTSILNLLLRDIEEDAIVVQFSTWLPGSDQVLIADLLTDLYKETRKHVYVPGLRKGLRSFSKILGETVGYLKALPLLVRETTQREDLANLSNLLAQLPMPIVILLDEIDRKQAPDLAALLKLIRGVSSLPNLTFVCAMDRGRLENAIAKIYDTDGPIFFEKLFPNIVEIPTISPVALKEDLLAGISQEVYQ